MIIFARQQRKFPILNPNQIRRTGDVVYLDADAVDLSRVDRITINEDTVVGDGIGGGVGFVTVEEHPIEGLYNAYHSASLDDKAIKKMINIVNNIESSKGVKVKRRKIPNEIYELTLI